MKAIVQGLHSPDADLTTYSPAEPSNFGVLIQILASPEGVVGEESFDIVVCTPLWLAASITASGPVLGRHFLFVARWNFDEIRSFLTHAIESENADDWPTLASRLSRIARWEFEDYDPSVPVE